MVNGYNVGEVETATSIPSPDKRFISDKKIRLVDGLVPVVKFVPGVWAEYDWFVSMYDTQKALAGSCVSNDGQNCKSIKQAQSQQKPGTSIIMWLDHAYLHDTAHKGCEDPGATAACHPTMWQQEGCTGCARVADLMSTRKLKQRKHQKSGGVRRYKKKAKTLKNDSKSTVTVLATPQRRVTVFGP